MNEKLSPIQKLDYVLEFLARNEYAKGGITDGKLIDEISKVHPQFKQGNDYGSDMIRLLEKLVKDENVIHDDVGYSDRPKVYRITFEGKLLIQHGGYISDYNNKIAKEKAISDQNQRMEKNEERLVEWTKRLAYMTIAAALIIVAWEMYKTFYLDR